MTQAIPSAVPSSQDREDLAEVRTRPVTHGKPRAADRGRHVRVRKDGSDDRFGLRHHLFRRSVVDAQRGQVDVVEADASRVVPATIR